MNAASRVTGHNPALGQSLAPFNFRVRDVLNVNDLGYDYAAAQAVVSVGGTG
jgi:hypothetical protein